MLLLWCSIYEVRLSHLNADNTSFWQNGLTTSAELNIFTRLWCNSLAEENLMPLLTKAVQRNNHLI